LVAPQGVLAQALSGAFGTVSPTALAQLRAAWEAVNNRWNQWVLNYSQSKQLDLLKDIGFESPSWADLLNLLFGLLVAVALGGSAWAWWDRHRQDPWLRLLTQARRRIEQAGVPLPPQSPPRSMAAALPGMAFGPTSGAVVGIGAWQPVRDWLLKLEALRYARAAPSQQQDRARERADLRALQAEFRQLAWPPKRA
jgi:protein-glutamine gamma-glutamyltransferase